MGKSKSQMYVKPKQRLCVIDDNPESKKHNGWHFGGLEPQRSRSRAFYCQRNSTFLA